MANNDPGAKPAIFGLLSGIMFLVGGPVGLVAAGIACASGYALGRAIRRSRDSGSSKTSSSHDYSNYTHPKYEPPPVIPDYTNIIPLIRNPVNSSTNISRISTEELTRLRDSMTQNREYNNTYAQINHIADLNTESEDVERQSRPRQSQRRTYSDEYGQIWEE
jgi:hypothetical protein